MTFNSKMIRINKIHDKGVELYYLVKQII